MSLLNDGFGRIEDKDKKKGDYTTEALLTTMAVTAVAVGGAAVVSTLKDIYDRKLGKLKNTPKSWKADSYLDDIEKLTKLPVTNDDTVKYNPVHKDAYPQSTSNSDTRKLFSLYQGIEKWQSTDESGEKLDEIDKKFKALRSGKVELKTLNRKDTLELLEILKKELVLSNKLFADENDKYEAGREEHFSYIMHRLHLVLRSLQQLTGKVK